MIEAIELSAPPLEKAEAFPLAEYERRWDLIQDALGERGIDVLLVTDPAEIYWTCGYDSFGGYQFQVAIVDRDAKAPILVVHELEAENARTAARTSAVVGWRHEGPHYGVSPGNPARVCGELVAQLAGDRRVKVGVSLESFSLAVAHFEELQAKLPTADWVNSSNLIAEARLIKSDLEIAEVRKAALIADASLEAALGSLREGMSELDLLSVCQWTANALGSDYPAMPPLVLSGDRTVLGHRTPSSRAVRDGDIVILECIGVSARYHANVARTAAIGAPGALVEEVAGLAAAAVEECIDAAGPGVEGAELDEVSRRITEKFDDARLHRLGYGLEAAYPPLMTGRLSCSRGDPRILEPGMVISISPHLYLRRKEPRERFTVVCGSDVLITESGAESLSRVPLSLVVV